MPTVYVKTPWRVVGGVNQMASAIDYPGDWSDVTGQPDNRIPPTKNLMLARGIITNEQKSALDADARYLTSTSLDSIFVTEAREYDDDRYASPTGSAEASGERTAPITLAEGVARIKSGDTLYLLAGVYSIDDILSIPAGVIFTSAPGEVAIITAANGDPPRVHVGAGTLVRGAWFGGSRTAESTAVTQGSDVTYQQCVFFGYNQCIAEGGASGCSYLDNLFVNCGADWLQHSIYVSNSQAAEGRGALIRRNVFIGGYGYHIHLWHGPTNTIIDNNFSADGSAALAVDGYGHIITDNVMWSQRADVPYWPLLFSANSGGVYAGNVHGAEGRSDRTPREWYAGGSFSPDLSVSNNAFAGSVAFGADAISNDDVSMYIGTGAEAVNAAVEALETAFAQAVNLIQSDATILPAWQALRAAMAAWRRYRLCVQQRELLTESMGAVSPDLRARIQEIVARSI